jgi:sugar phosphate isomerase/epimerase
MKRALGIAPVFGGKELKNELTLIKKAGFDATFLGWHRDTMTEQVQAARDAGLFVQSIHAPFCNSDGCPVSTLWQEGEAGVATANRLIDCVKDTAAHGIPVMVIHPFIGFKDHDPTQTGLDNYARIIEVANKLGVKLGFENVEGEEYLAAIMKRFWNEPSLGFCLDTGHEMCYNRHKDMLALYGEKLCHTHFNDNLGVRGEDITFHDDLHFMPTDGIADWHNIMERIRKTGYNDIFMTELTYADRIGKNGEPLNYAQMPIEEYMATALEKIRKAISM